MHKKYTRSCIYANLSFGPRISHQNGRYVYLSFYNHRRYIPTPKTRGEEYIVSAGSHPNAATFVLRSFTTWSSRWLSFVVLQTHFLKFTISKHNLSDITTTTSLTTPKLTSRPLKVPMSIMIYSDPKSHIHTPHHRHLHLKLHRCPSHPVLNSPTKSTVPHFGTNATALCLTATNLIKKKSFLHHKKPLPTVWDSAKKESDAIFCKE
jgi:hypothetical protein